MNLLIEDDPWWNEDIEFVVSSNPSYQSKPFVVYPVQFTKDNQYDDFSITWQRVVDSAHAFAHMNSLNPEMSALWDELFGVEVPTCRAEMEQLIDQLRELYGENFEETFVAFFSLYWSGNCLHFYTPNFLSFESTISNCPFSVSILNEEKHRIDQYTDSFVYRYNKLGDISFWTDSAEDARRELEVCVSNRAGDDEFCIPLNFNITEM